MRLWLARFVCGACLVAVAAPALANPPLPPSPPVVIDEYAEDEDCLEPIPVRSSVGHLSGEDKISLDVWVLLDEVDPGRGAQIMGAAQESYDPLEINLNVMGYQSMAVPATTTVNGDPAIPSQDLIDASKAAVGGRRPAGTDAVYTITSKDLSDAAGRADCIGGIRYPDMSFAVGEDFDSENTAIGPVTFYANASAKIAAHELGHLLGAHHHYFNCAEGALTEVSELEPSPCTLMSPFVDFGSINFGAAEAVVVRGHAEEYAAP